jgi:amidase
MLAVRDPFNAFLDLPEVPVANAESGPLSGLRLVVKDIFDVAGYRTGCGNPQKEAGAPIAARTAPAVQALLDAGARFVGKTQTDELAFSLIGQNAHFPQPVNPAAPDRVTGGSSSGSAAAVTGGLADIAIGSDTGGSIRAPASFCGLIGLRTTHGRISLNGMMPLAPSLDTFGWFARDAEVYEKVGEVLLGWAPSSPLEGRERRQALAHPLRLPALDALLLGDAEAGEYRRIVELVSRTLGEPTTAPPLSHSIDDLYWCFRKLQAYEAWAVHGPWISHRDRDLGPGVKERFEFGATIGCEVAASETKRRSDFRAELAQILGDDGLLVLPTVPGAAPLKSLSFDQTQVYRERALHLLCLSGLSGFPQITLPFGSIDGAPFGISLLGPHGSDLKLIRLGRLILESAGKA